MYQGRPVHLAGEREFEPWSIEVYNDNDFIVRNAFESWVNTMANSDTTHGAMYTSLYQVDMQVHQLDRNDQIVKEYTFHDAFPLQVGQIQLDWDANNQIEISQSRSNSTTIRLRPATESWFRDDERDIIVPL